jgi:hypothetical protein
MKYTLKKYEEMLFALLRASLHERVPEESYFAEASVKDWWQCYRLAARQGVKALAWDGIVKLPSELMPPKEVKLSWATGVMKYEEVYKRYCQTADELSHLYAEHGISTMLMKGVGISALYPVPSHREGGDIDIYTYSADTTKMSHEEANNLADQLMKDRGIEVDVENYKHSNFYYKGIPIENHKCFLNVHESPFFAHADEVEKFARTMAYAPNTPSAVSSVTNTTDEVEAYSSTIGFSKNMPITYNSTVQKSKKSIWSRLFGNKYNEVYSSIFAPAEVKRKSHLQVQVYLHLYKESEKVKSLAQESDKNAERRDYIPLSLKLKKGDKVDVEFNVYGETSLTSERKSIIWQGSFTKCSFDYFVPKDIDVDELSCETNIFVNGAMIGEMRFITQIVNAPRNLNPEILSHRFNRIFISYAHQDAQQIKLLALAYKAQGVDYFYDRDSLAPGDVYEEKIFDYIDSSDLFVLCWSKNAAVSDYVAKEKNRALLRAYPQLSQRDATLKICPISIEPRADLPNDMKYVYNFEVI